MDRRRYTGRLGAALLAALLPAGVAALTGEAGARPAPGADDAGGPQDPVTPDDGPLAPPAELWSAPRLAPSADEARRAALGAALDWLARSQRESADGSWPNEDAEQRAPEAVAALASLALMSGGSTPGRGPHGEAVARATDYLLSRVHLDPRAAEVGFIGSLTANDSRMHSHGLATLALAEAFAMSPDSRRGQRLSEALPLAVDLIERTQGAEGGWWYDPERVASHEGSVTIALVQALRSARNAGVVVDGEVIALAERYVIASQAPDGSFRYTLGSPVTTVALTAAAISTLNAAGRYDDSIVRRGIDAIWRGLEAREVGGSGERAAHPFYERFYLSQAFWQLSDTSHFERWYERELERMLDTQQDDGGWSGPELGSPYGSAYATSMNALFLGIPDGLLPIFQR